MQTVIFLLYHGYGHFNACFRLAKVLQSHYNIVFAGFSFFQNHVEDQGFTYYPLKTVPFGLSFENWVNTIEKKGNIYCHSLKDRWRNRLYKLRERELNQLIENTAPDYLLIDSWQSTDFIALYPKLKANGIRTAIFHAMLATSMEPDLPPLNSLMLPASASSVKKAQRLFHWKEVKHSLSQWIKYFGKSNRIMIGKQLVDNRVPEKYISRKPALFSPGFDNIDELIMVPREFEFPSAYRSSRQHYLGFMIDHSRKEKGDVSFEAIFKKIRKKLSDRCHLIYCSFGTVPYDDPEKVKLFLKNLIAVATVSDHLFLTSGNSHDILKDFNLPDNMFIFKTVPQLKVLSQASIFISHGGLNSVKESIHARVPMLIYPMDPRTDNNGNSGRVVYHQLGLRGDLAKDSQQNIREKIDLLITDPVYRKNIDAMKKTNESYTDLKVLNVIQNIPPLD